MQKCSTCGIFALEDALTSPAGALLERAGELLFQSREMGIIHLKSELSATEFAAMRVLRQEQIAFDNERMK